MKLALIRRQFAATGGAELYLQRLMEALAGAGHEVHLFAEQWPAERRSGGIAWHPVAVAGGRADRAVRFAQAVDEQLARARFDCVFSLERTLRQDVYRAGDGVHRVWLERRRQFAPWWKRLWLGRSRFHRQMLRLEAATLDPRRTRRVIVNSDMVRGEILRHFAFPPERLHLVRNGVDVARCQRGSRALFRQRWGLDAQAFVLLFAGSGWERKGLRWVLEAFGQAARKDWRLVVAGKDRPPWRAPERVLFCGPLAEMEHAYAGADLLVFPPIYEPAANVVFEALAAGLPVVTSRCNGAAEILQAEVTGTVVERPDDVAGLVAAMERWSQRRGRAAVPPDSLSLAANVAQTVAILERAAQERRAGD